MNFMNLACITLIESVLIINSTPWLTTRRRLCPICKRDIIVETAEVDEQSSLLNHREDDWRGDTAGSV